MHNNQKFGRKGEDIASKYLRNNNYNILERNFRCKQGEVDIIVYDINTKELVFVEVKTRSSYMYGSPKEAVGKFKQKHIISVAKYYTYKSKIHYAPIRFDVIEIIINDYEHKINHIKQAFC